MRERPPCPRQLQRVAFDQRRGQTTSQATLDFIRRSCSCDRCSDWREATKFKLSQGSAP